MLGIDFNNLFKSDNFSIFFGVLFPITLITGPFLPDLFVTCSAIFILFFIIYKKKYKFFLQKFLYILLFFWVYLILSSLLSEQNVFSLKTSLVYGRYIFFGLFIFYFIHKDNNFVKNLFYGFTIAYILLIIDSYYSILNSTYEVNQMFKPRNFSNFFTNEKIIGSFLSRTLPFYFGLLFFLNEKKIYSYLAFIISLLLIPLILLSGERTSILYLFLTMFLSFFIFKQIRIPILVLIFSAFLLMFLTNTFSHFKNRIYDYTIYQMYQYSNTDDTFVFSIEHEKLFINSFKIFKDNPLIGVGPNNFRKFCSKYNTVLKKQESTSNIGCSTSPHNTYLQLLSETGILGFSLVLCFFLQISYILTKEFYYRNFRSKINFRNYEIFFFISLFISLWPFIPTGNFFNNWISIIYFLPLGFILYGNKNRKN